MAKLKGLFFWKRKKKSEVDEAEKMIQLYIKYIPELKKIMRNADETASEGEMIGMMYDFYANHGSTQNPFDNDNEMGMGTRSITLNSLGAIVPPEDARIAVTPLSVRNELETIPTPFTVEKLDEKIKTLKDKSLLINQEYAKAQIDGLAKRLENRKQYKENHKFFDGFPNTTDEKIDNLLKKYKLVMKESDLFTPTFPKEAVEVMKEYTKVAKKVSGEKPVFYVIAEVKDFKKKYEKLDPILLVQSPFGFYWQILGAWDKEMILLHEL